MKISARWLGLAIGLAFSIAASAGECAYFKIKSTSPSFIESVDAVRRLAWHVDAPDVHCQVMGTTDLVAQPWVPVAYARTAGHTGTTQLPSMGQSDAWAEGISVEREVPSPLPERPGNVFLDNEEIVFPFPAVLHPYATQWIASDETGAQVASGISADGLVRAGMPGIGWYRFDFPLPTNTVSVYPTMFLRGTFNHWSATPMVRVANYIWRGVATFNDADPRFKFDIHGDWLDNFGDNNADGIGDANGVDIPAPFGNGSYVITFNDQTLAYSAESLDAHAGGTADWTTVAVLASPSGPTPQDSPFGMDGALSWFSHSDDSTAAYARLASLAGVNWIRDRTSWSDLEPARNAFAPASTQYDRAAAIQSGYGLKVLHVLHDLPAWAADATLDGGARNCFPRDLRDAYRFYRHLAQRFAGNVHAFEPWNEADIEPFGGHVVDERCSFQKAVFLAIKAADTNLLVGWNANAKFASTMDAEGIIRNETWPNFDTFNIHSYDPPEQYGDRMESTRHAACGKPIWITECGIYAPPEPHSHELNVSNQVRQASFFARAFASLQHAGVNRYFAFLLPHYYEGWINSQYGLLRADLTPRPAYVACAAIGRLLAAARPLGRHEADEPALRLYAFRAFPDGVDRDVLVVWATNSVAWSLPGHLAVESLHDVLGRPLAAWPDALDERAVFAVLPRGEAEKLELEPPHTPSFRFEGEASPVVMQLEMPRAQNKLEHGARLLMGTSNLPIHVYNFGTGTVHGTVQVEEAPPGWIGGSPECILTLASMERQTIHLPVTMPNSGPDAAFGGWIKLRGEFGPAGRPALAFRLMNELLNVDPGSVVEIPGATNAAAWQNNIAEGGTLSITAGANGVVFDAQFAAHGGGWAYPWILLASGERPTIDCEGLVLELEVLEGGGTFRALLEEENGSVYECGIGVGGPPEHRAVLLFAWAQAQSWAPPDDNGRLDPDKIVRLHIGVNAGPGERVQWQVQNVQWGRWTPATFYVDSEHGSDANIGTAHDAAWQTLDRVNNAPLIPGDVVRFKRGGLWRGQLFAKSGAPGRRILYSAYGEGPMPILQGSLARNHPSDWIETSPGIWATAPNAPFPCDVGILILDHGEQWGVKKWSLAALADPLDYWHDPASRRVFVRHAANPAAAYGSVELALTRHIVDFGGTHDVTFDGLHIRYGGAHGFFGWFTRRITIRHCDIAWIGGGLQFYGSDGAPIRLGNGIEFWNGAEDNLVEHNRIWQIYDAALTNQGNDEHSHQRNITYRHNVIWSCEFSFEFWNRPASVKTENIVFEHNTCVDAGRVWSHGQRPDPVGAHLVFYVNPSDTTGVVIRNNIFAHGARASIRMDNDWRAGLDLHNNLHWTGDKPVLFWLLNTYYGPDDFARYQAELGLDADSLLAEPVFVDPAARDYRLAPGSPGATLAADGGPVGARLLHNAP